MDGLNISKIDKSFGDNRVLREITFEVEFGEIVVLLGPSGCGKSTLLNIIAGLEPADQGEILWNGANIGGIPPHKRGFGLMFQDHALFPHRNVFDNVAFGLQMARWPRDKIDQRVSEILELVGLPDFAQRDVNTLSGGEGQRVALARSLAPHPGMLMLDEPLGSLDRSLRERLVFDLKKILKECSQTALYVTHDHEEAYVIADRIVVMNQGRIEQIGPPPVIYQEPASVFVAKFLGLYNLLAGTIKRERDQAFVETPIGRWPVQNEFSGRVTVLLRPDRVHLARQGEKQLSGVVSEVSFRGSTCQLSVEVKEQRLVFQFPSSVSLPQPGETIHLGFAPAEAIRIFPA
jgi:ABC-type Fe3+/spermidine/putrescine transport system ATPase subunit